MYFTLVTERELEAEMKEPMMDPQCLMIFTVKSYHLDFGGDRRLCDCPVIYSYIVISVSFCSSPLPNQ